jgi:hypothetical protein
MPWRLSHFQCLRDFLISNAFKVGKGDIQIPAMPGARFIRRVYQGLDSFWEGPLCPEAQRNKHLLPHPPLRPSMLLQANVARNYFG